MRRRKEGRASWMRASAPEEAGAIIDYSLRLYGVSLKWRTRIEVFEPERRFVDTQLKGPYRTWHHLHEFEEVEQGTRMRDVVDYELPFGPLGTVARALFDSLKRLNCCRK